ncbi:MAG: UDP-N-acetyl-D-mannosamine dehydrogenase [Alphaproteobacteria bacterium]|nr:UDP-N-acetyl-D-mannosamine dehydrogenase [Alphaproteobacteria bacterium]
MTFNTLSVLGLGYVGLPTAAVFASRGVTVVGVDTNAAVVDMINRGEVHIVEPDLGELVQGAVTGGTLRAATQPEAADAFIIAVPTPFTDDFKPDLRFLIAAAESLAAVLKSGDLIVIESTVPVGATQSVCERLAEMCPNLRFPHQFEDADIRIAHSPERVLPGRVIAELVRNDRVIGGISPTCGERAAALYDLAVEGECLLTTAPTAELVKLSENAYRDVNIAFANELSVISERLGIDPWEAIELANHHPRVNILQPGPGVGGHCIAVDPWFIVDSAPEDSDLIRAARKVNDAKPHHLAERVIAAAREQTAPVIACLGLAYKADIDDLRQSPAVTITRLLAEAGAGEILAVEPHVGSLPPELDAAPGVTLADLNEALARADIVVLLVDHKDFKELDPARLSDKQVFDARGIWR